jgi:hypothetical protein
MGRYDIGEHSFGQVLIDDVDGNGTQFRFSCLWRVVVLRLVDLFFLHAGKLDLVITTMNGRIIVLGTDTKYHALRTWTSEFQGRNGNTCFSLLSLYRRVRICNLQSGFAAREGGIGIYALDSTRKRGDISGQSLPFQFTIEDNTRGQGDPRHSALRDGRPYKVIFPPCVRCTFALLLMPFAKVKVMLGTSSLLLEASYDKPGTYLVEVCFVCLLRFILHQHRLLFSDCLA